MPRHLSIVPALLAALLLTGCANGFGSSDFVLYRESVHPSYVPDNFRFNHGNKTMPLVVHGSALGTNADGIADALASLMDGKAPAGVTDFVATKSADAGTSRLVVQAAPSPALLDRSLCDGSGVSTDAKSPSGVPAEFLFAYCNGSKALSSIRMRVNAETVASDAFRSGAVLVPRRLFPFRDPNRDDDCRIKNPC